MTVSYKTLVGQRFNKWTILKAFSKNNKGRFLCRCDCGRIAEVDSYAVYHGKTKHCGKCNTYTDEGTHMKCTTSNGSFFIFDKSDYATLKKYTWRITCGYVAAAEKDKTIFLHKLLLSESGDANMQGDHINQDKTDNRRCNLRAASHMENQWNRGLRKDSTSGYMGVCFSKSNGRYIAYINANKKRKYLGYHDNPVDAALAYDRAAIKLHGKFACTNIMDKEVINNA